MYIIYDMLNFFYDIEQYQKKYINIVVNIIDLCNKKCSYCYNMQYRFNNVLNLSDLEKFIDNSDLKIVFDIIGGEPTLHPNLYDFCKKMNNNSFLEKIYIYTNITANVDQYKQLLQFSKINLVFSIHSYDDFIKNLSILKLIDKYKNIEYRFVANKDFLLNEKNYLCFFKDVHIKEHTSIQLIDFDNYYISDEIMHIKNIINDYLVDNHIYQRKYFDLSKISSFKDYINLNSNIFTILQFTNQLCYAGIHQFYIHSNGDISRCEQIYLNANKQLIGHIHNSHINNFIHNNPKTCHELQCFCPMSSKKICLNMK